MQGPQKKSKHHIKRTVIGVFVLVVAFVQIVTFMPKPANALFGFGDITFSTTIQDIPRALSEAVTSVVKTSGDIAYKNALRVFTQQIAYDAAVKIASGGAGQEPLFNTEDFKESVRDAGNAAVGDFLDTLTTDGWGWSLCDIDPAIKVNIQYGIALDLGLEEPRQAKCTVTSILDRFNDGIFSQVTFDGGLSIKGIDPAQLSRTILKEFPNMWGDEQTNVGQYLTVYKGAVEKKFEAETAEAASQEKGFKDLVSAITGRTKTPAATIEATQNFALSQTTTAEETNTGSIIADMVGVFTNTLVKKYMEFILVKGLNPAADSTSSQYGGQFGRTSSIAAAEAKFASFNQPNLSAGGSVDILNTLSSCPTSFAEPENCVIDASFRTAVEQQLRLEEAIDRGYINGNKPFGYGDGGSQLNYTEGYPYRSLVLLRRHRVVPVSWELAASYIREYGGGARSLNDLIREFDDESSQYYQLIDPDWVLKAPASQCVNSGYGETFLFDEYLDADGKSETPKVRQIQRNTSCVDDQSCLSEDEAGNCQQYGYCTKEDPIWRFGGDSCPDYYNTCTTYIDSQGQPDSYLRDTLDFNGCSADNVGCQWYCKEYNEVDDRWECYWDDVNNDDYSMWSDGLFDPWGLVYTPGPDYRDWMSHLTAGAETCTADVAGCNEYIRTTHGTNLINNASFEYYTGDPDNLVSNTFDAWVPIGGTSIEAVTPDTPGVIPFSGITALSMLPGAPLSEGIMSSFNTGSPIRGRSFTFSVYAMSLDPTACNNDGQVDVGNTGFIESSSTAIDNVSDQWQRYEVTVNLPDTIVASEQTLDVRFYADSVCDMLYDAVMLEESSSAGQYADYGTVNRIYLTGERDTCDPDDVGCQWYDPLAGGDQIPAQITPSDQCPSQDVGCKAFEEVPLTTIVPNPNHIERSGNYCHGGGNEGEACLTSLDCGTGYCFPSISFIPNTGLQCSAAYVGCEEYTNLDEVADGGEGKEYYTYLKQCVLPGEINTAPYYAWEGDAVAGYQLRAFRLKQSDIGLPYAPCTHLEVGPTLPLDCEDGSNTVIDCGPAGTNEYGTNPDCTQFFDASLNVFYRYKSQTITVSDDCHPERNSIDEDIYYGIPSESRACPQEFMGCREYLGNSGYNYRQIFFDDFEDGTTQGWTPATVSTNSVIAGGHSLASNVNTDIDKTVTVEDGKTYELRFWGMTPAASETITVRFDTVAGANGNTWFADQTVLTLPPTVTLVPEWQEFRLGPVTIDISDPAGWTGLPSSLQILSVGNQIYLDNIELVETTNSQYLVRDSFRTCYGSENCEAYSDSDGNIHYLKSFSKLCEENVAGCEALIDTMNTSSPFSEDYGDPLQTQSFITIPPDETVRFINKEEVRCSSSDKGCAELGEPVFDERNNITGYDTVYLKDNADQYSDIWCAHSEVGCEEFGFSGSTGKTFFKDPAGRLCEYKQLLGSYVLDWYIVGTEELCDKTDTPPNPAIPAFVCEGGSPALPAGTVCNPDNPVECTNGSRCIPWVGVCEAEFDGCEAYRDPVDPVGCQPNCPYENGVLFDENCAESVGGLPGCETYYYIDRTVDATSCNGVVNEEKGCKLFNDTSQSINYSADLSPDGLKKYCNLDPSDVTFYGQECETDVDCSPPTGICIENPEFGPPVLGRYGTCSGGTNPGDPCTATGAECLGGSCNPLYTANSSPYNDSNTVLKVRRDRVCDEWLYCKTSFEVDDELDLDGDGKTKEDVCFEIGLCDELGPGGLCAGTVTTPPANVTGDTGAYPFDDFQNLSGFVSAGLQYGCKDDHSVSCTVATELTDCAGPLGEECHIIEGLYPYSEMFEVGMGGAITKDLVQFGDFESDAIEGFMVCDDEQENKGDSCIVDAHCIPNEELTDTANCKDVNEDPSWSPIFPALDSEIIVVEGEETLGNAALDENNYLLYKAGALGVCDDASDNEGTTCILAGSECTGGGSCSFVGLGVKVDLGSNILNNTEYIASFDFRFEYLPQEGSEEIAVSLAQFDGVNIVGENLLGYFNGSTGWTQQVLEPVEVTGLPDENAQTFLLIRNMGGNISFALDNVSMKPALAVKAFDSPGIRGDYFTHVYQPTVTSVPGLNEECFTDTNLSVPCAANPYEVPMINWYEPCVACYDESPAAIDCSIPDSICCLCGNADRFVTIPGEMQAFVPNNNDLIIEGSSARWEGGINFPSSGIYTLFFNVNDGVRIWVDDLSPGAEIVSAWGNIPTLGFMYSEYFTAGWHPIKIEFNNAEGAYGGLQLGWVTGQWDPSDCGGGIPNPFCVEYAWDANGDGEISPIAWTNNSATSVVEGMAHPDWNRITAIPNSYLIPQSSLTTELERVFGSYLGTYVSNNLDYSVPAMANHLNDQAGTDEQVAVRWTGQILLETAGNYGFQFNTNDGLRFYIDDLANPVLDDWNDGDNNNSVTLFGLDAGWHPIMVEYYQNLGDAQMIFTWRPAGAAGFTIVPAANLSTTDGDEAYIVRSCRAYPREDSEKCQYTNSDLVEFNGWQGYCIETDPTNANKCITWWPVDVISGESSVFGTVEPAGYKGRRPLYMCVEASGNFDDTTRTLPGNIDTQDFCGENNVRTGLVEQAYGYRRPVQTNWLNAECDIPWNYINQGCSGDYACGSLENIPQLRSVASCGGRQMLPGGAAAGFYGWVSCTGGNGINRTVAAIGEDVNYHEWEIDRIEWVQQRSSHGDWPSNAYTWVANAENGWHILGDQGGWNKDPGESINCQDLNCFEVKVNFDSVDKTIESYFVHMSDGSTNFGGMWVMGYIYLRDSCKEIAKVVSPTDDKAWAQRTANTSSYVIPELLYTYSSDSAPFGAIVAGQGDDPGQTWDSMGDQQLLNPLYVDNFDNYPLPAFNNQRSGRPYSCDGDCVPKVCFGGDYDTAHRSVQYPCSTDADCGGTADDRGVCVGVGFCSDAQTVACEIDQDCIDINGGSCVGSEVRGRGDGPTDPTGDDWAIERLQRIFGYIYGAWRWDDGTGSYQDITNTAVWAQNWNDAFVTMPLCNMECDISGAACVNDTDCALPGDSCNAGLGPRPTWPGLPGETDLCGILPTIDNVLVNGATGDVELFGGGSVTLTFNSFVDPEQEALKHIVVDWGDTSTSHIMWNGAPKSDPSQPHLMSHTYDAPGGILNYNIEIMLIDNWGFCNDQPETDSGSRDCSIGVRDYQGFDGVITVYPS